MIITPRSFLKYRRVTSIIFFLVFSLLLGTMGMSILTSESRDYPETEATILSITELPSADPDNTDYEVIVEYTVNGVSYIRELNSYSSSYKVGGTVTVRYNPENPGEVEAQMTIFGYLMVGGAVVILALAIRSFVRSKHNEEKYAEHLESYNPSENNGVDAASGTTYFFHPDKRFVSGHIMENADGQVVFEGYFTRFTLFIATPVEFRNHVYGSTRTHTVGHTITTKDNGISSYSYFKFDGEDVWDHLRAKGIRISSNFTGGSVGECFAQCAHLSYTVTLGGEPFATIAMTGVDQRGSATGLRALGAPGYFRIDAATDDLDLLFLVAMALARCNTYTVG